MKEPLIWIIDEEWGDYEVEHDILPKEYPGCTIRRSTYDYKADLEEFGYRADLILAQVYASIPKETIDRLENCKGIAVYGGGYDRIDIKAAKEKGIPVTNVQGYCAEDIADYVMAAMYRFNKKLDFFNDNLKNGLWGAGAVDRPIHRLSNCTLAVVGCGRIGQTVAARAKALGMRVVGYDPHASVETLEKVGIEPVSLEEGLAQADFVTVHVKYTPATHHLLSMQHFSQMKKSAVLINSARGGILVEDDLIAAVDQGVIAGAVVDVITHEPPAPDEKIFGHENLIVTPHVSYISVESYQELKMRTLRNAMKMYRGERPDDLVNG